MRSSTALRSASPGSAIRVAGARRNGDLRLSVHNDGPSLPADWQATHTGIGIGNLRTRLQILHGSESELQLRDADTGGVEVVGDPAAQEGVNGAPRPAAGTDTGYGG